MVNFKDPNLIATYSVCFQAFHLSCLGFCFVFFFERILRSRHLVEFCFFAFRSLKAIWFLIFEILKAVCFLPWFRLWNILNCYHLAFVSWHSSSDTQFCLSPMLLLWLCQACSLGIIWEPDHKDTKEALVPSHQKHQVKHPITCNGLRPNRETNKPHCWVRRNFIGFPRETHTYKGLTGHLVSWTLVHLCKQAR